MWTFASLMEFTQSALSFETCFQFLTKHLLISVCKEFHHLVLVALLAEFPEDYC